MWYFQADMLSMMLGFSVLFVLAGQLVGKLRPGARLTPFLIVFDLFLIGFVSEKLAAFYAAYTAGNWLMLRLLRQAKGGRRPLFIAFCLLDVLPLFLVRLIHVAPGTLFYITLIGFAYHMLRAVDALFFVYRTGQEIHPLAYANYLLFFPVFTAGPILRWQDFAPCYYAPRPLTADTCERCVKRLILGLFKKLVLAAWVQSFLSRALSMDRHAVVSAALAVLCCAALYLDLSAYSDMAVAVGSFLGIPVPENFHFPFASATFTQFWRRWHITLLDWFREHLFPEAEGQSKALAALTGFCTMVLLGLWHGFGLTTAAGGVYFGVLLAGEKLLGLTDARPGRGGQTAVYVLRCAAVAFLFGVGAMFFVLSPQQLRWALGGFLRW